MKLSVIKGFSFGITSGVITTLGLITGLHASTQSTMIIIDGILIIAIADAMSDAFGIYASEESTNKNTRRQIIESAFTTFISKFIFALTFIIPILIFDLPLAIVVCIIYGLLLLAIFSYYIAKQQKRPPHILIFQHIFIAVAVLIATHFAGQWISGV